MTASANGFTVFTKSWRGESLAELAQLVRRLGFDGVELPVRPGYQVPPENVADGLPQAARIFADHGLKIGSVAGPTDEPTVAAMGAAGVKILRICVQVDREVGYRATEERLRRRFDALVPALEAHGVTLGIQNHCGWFIGSAVGLMRLIEGYEPRHVAAVLDPAHCALDGEPDAMAIDIASSHLALVNLKNARWVRDEGDGGRWRVEWTLGREGLSSWAEVAAELKKRRYPGDLCLSAEYSPPGGKGQLMEADVEPLIAADLAYARDVFA
jgi:sugar phosphate isomerase/epimerase